MKSQIEPQVVGRVSRPASLLEPARSFSVKPGKTKSLEFCAGSKEVKPEFEISERTPRCRPRLLTRRLCLSAKPRSGFEAGSKQVKPKPKPKPERAFSPMSAPLPIPGQPQPTPVPSAIRRDMVVDPKSKNNFTPSGATSPLPRPKPPTR